MQMDRVVIEMLLLVADHEPVHVAFRSLSRQHSAGIYFGHACPDARKHTVDIGIGREARALGEERSRIAIPVLNCRIMQPPGIGHEQLYDIGRV